MRYIQVKYDIYKKANYKTKDSLIKYLKRRESIAAIPGSFIDPFTNQKLNMNKVFSDGKYEWDESLAFLVEKYNIYISQDFLIHAGIEILS